MAVKIRLKRMGKKFAPFYRVVVLDSRKRRDGRVIEEIGIYDPMQEPSLIKIDGERAKYWLGVGAQPSNTVHNLLKITGDWQAFKGLKGAEGSLKVKEVNADAAAQAVAEAADRAEKLKAEASAKAPSRRLLKNPNRPLRRPEMLADALEHLVRGIVDNPDDVTVNSRSLRRGELLEVRVNPEDLGRVIGRSGRTARALRTVVSALANGPVRVDVVDTDRR